MITKRAQLALLAVVVWSALFTGQLWIMSSLDASASSLAPVELGSTKAFSVFATSAPTNNGSGSSTGRDDDGDAGQVCTGLDSDKIDTQGDPQTVTVTAPAGKTIVSYCVKAGSTTQGNGPVYVTLAEPVTSLVIRHPSGKAVSHYSVAYRSTPTPTLTPTPSPTQTPTPTGPFDWNWHYSPPSCDALTVTYPADLPTHQSNDINIRIETNLGEITLNYHHNTADWSDTTGFTYSQHPNWPAGVTSYTVTWVQVAGTNYHWQGRVSCLLDDDGDVSTFDIPTGVSQIEGWRTSTVTLRRGQAASSDAVMISQGGVQGLSLQHLTAGTWNSVKTVLASDGESARIIFPKQDRRGTYKYRLVIPDSESITGTSTGTFTVRVR